jgi:ubiquinone/menaquinone biosynthesis C-methylase UbiE/pimeloyl-ACP methyl ester carboxylesterase
MPSLSNLNSLSGASLRRLHRGAITQHGEIVELLNRVLGRHVELKSGVDRKSKPRSAWIVRVNPRTLILDAPNLRADGQPQIYLHFDLDDTRYFFAAPPIEGGGSMPLRVTLPVAIYKSERRDLRREKTSPGSIAPRVKLDLASRQPFEGHLRDWSYQGMAVAMPAENASRLDETFELEVMDGKLSGQQRFASIRRRSEDIESPGWIRLGLEVSAVEPSALFPVDHRSHILSGGIAQRTWRKIALASAANKRLPNFLSGRVESSQIEIDVISYKNFASQTIVGLVDKSSDGIGGTAIVIPPAWGRTKESFLPLARTLLATFDKEGEPVVVLRFDGTNRRGESYIDPECRRPGDEYLHYRFSRGVEDICTSLDFVRNEYQPRRVILVTFSLGAIEGRRAAASQFQGELDGWVSVVGMVDLQSGLRTVSGGVDFAYGQALGVKFGRHELVGVVSDMDHTGQDAFENDLVFLEDAKRDMAKLTLPITWVHGKYDAWMDIDRVRSLLAAGPSEGRKLYEIPSGHQMRTSQEALETFQLISIEVARMALGREVSPMLPDLSDLKVRTNAEQHRRPSPKLDRSEFWSDYLLGRDRRLGFELMAATSSYRSLMNSQIDQLFLKNNHHVVDMGGGTGDFSMTLARRNVPKGLRITQIDLVPEALVRAEKRLSKISESRFLVRRIAADLDLVGSSYLPLVPNSADSIIASLMLSYVNNPRKLLAAFLRALKPGGRLVVSSMRRDADISRIYINAIAELPPDRRRSHFELNLAEDFDELQRVFLNDAARLMQMEQDGQFQFYDKDEFSDMIRGAGFTSISAEHAFGDPPQAVILSACRPTKITTPTPSQDD